MDVGYLKKAVMQWIPFNEHDLSADDLSVGGFSASYASDLPFVNPSLVLLFELRVLLDQ